MKEAESFSIIDQDISNLPRQQKEGIKRVQKWVRMICRNKCNESNRVYVSPLKYKDKSDNIKNKTIIAVCGNLPDGPIVQIAKSVEEVTLEDLLKNYKLINYCAQEDSKSS